MSVKAVPADDSNTLFTVTLSSRAAGPCSIQTTVTSTASIASDWISSILSVNSSRLDSLLVGLDCEWRPSFTSGRQNPVAVLQLSVGLRCLVFQILRSDSIPPALISFLSDPRFKFLGVGIKDDVRKLTQDYEIGVKNMVDLRALAAEKLGREKMKRMGLKDLAREVIGIQVKKPREVTMSRWDQAVLKHGQIGYAAVDAFLSFEIGRRLFADDP